MNEVEILQWLYHPHILKFKETFEDKSKIYIVTEFFEGDSLYNWVFQHDQKTKRKIVVPMKEEMAREIVRKLLAALDHCHAQNIVHWDLKLENVLISSQGDIRLIDFGFSLKLSSLTNVLSNFCGTPSYMAPEIVKKMPYQPHYADMWALGVLTFVLLTGRFPFWGNSESELY